MKSNFYLNAFNNFTSDYFRLIPSKYVTFGVTPPKKINSQISENSSNKDSSLIFNQYPNALEEKFKFDFEKSSFKENCVNSCLKSNISDNIIEKNYTEQNPNCNLNCFKTGSKTILNIVNSCLLELFSDTIEKNDNKILLDNNSKTSVNGNKNYILKSLNEDCVFINKDTEEKKKDDSSFSFLQKINFSPIKNNVPIIPEKIEKQIINKVQEPEKKVLLINPQNIPKENNNIKTQNNLWNKSAFNAINNNYKNPAKILPQFNPPTNILYESNMKINSFTNITNITNVTNNYFFQCDNKNCCVKQNILGKNQKENNIIINKNNNLLLNSTFKITKCEDILQQTYKNNNPNDSLYGLYQLNQICINGVSISKFPVVSMSEDDLEVQLLSKMLTETDYFTIVDKYYINIPVLDEEKYNKPLYDKIFQKEKEKISDLYIIGKNLNENNPINLIRNYYTQIKSKILQIQKNYLSNNEKDISLNKALCQELEKLINSCNAITNTVTDYKKSGLKRKVFQEEESEDKNKKNIDIVISMDKENSDNDISNTDLLNKKRKLKKKHFKTYLCEFCNKAYSNGQGLGGHMSRIHPNQSYKYKDKIRIRREREEKRENLLNIKRDLFKKYGFDYDKYATEKNKSFIQKFLSEHNEEYKIVRKNRQKNKENISNYNDDIINNKGISKLITPMHPKLLGISQNKLNSMNNLRENLSKEKTSDKTYIKFNGNKIGDKEDEIGSIAKMKINFGDNKYQDTINNN